MSLAVRRRLLLVALATLPRIILTAQEPEPVRAGTSDVPVPVLENFVAPPYPGTAWAITPVTQASADVVVSSDGRVIDVRVLQPEEPPASSVPRGATSPFAFGNRFESLQPVAIRRSLDTAIRQWRFAPAISDGRPASVVVQVGFRFETFPPPEMSMLHSHVVTDNPRPADFSLNYAYGRCVLDTLSATFTMLPVQDEPVTRVAMALEPGELDSLYREMVRVGFFDYPALIRVSDSPVPPYFEEAAVVRRSTGIEVTIRATHNSHTLTNPSVTHKFEVVQNGRTYRVAWSDIDSGPAFTLEVSGVRSVIAVAQRIIKGKSSLPALEPVRRECRSLQ